MLYTVFCNLAFCHNNTIQGRFLLVSNIDWPIVAHVMALLFNLVPVLR